MGAAIPFAFQDNAEVARRFPDLHPAFAPQEALTEANRCLNCFDAPCAAACPTHIDVPRFIKKIATQNLMGSALSILDANVLGASCARVCPVEVLCEGACVMLRYNKQPIAIGRLQRHAMDHFMQRGASLPKKSTRKRSQRIVCVGAGPASLACAAELAQQGFAVTVLDRRGLPGGLNTYGVAEYKLRAPESLREVAMIAELGVQFRFGVSIEDEGDLAALEREYDAIFIGIGLGAMHQLRIPGADHNVNVGHNVNIIDALEFIARYKTASNLTVGNNVVVVGAGNTAIDAAIAARRMGAAHVTIVYRRTEDDISAFGFEYEHAKQEGVVFEWLAQPVAIHSDSLECTRMGSNFQLPCDMLIPAIGQTPLSLLERCRGPKYYSGGDCVNGGREVVDAVADGKRAAIAIAHSFEAQHA
ncbi:MAG: FAD-dependent oxidoreductase [Bryobacteraceae bacterium]|jgi:glutamate synthase (NADPH/NADH) small chain